MVVAVTGVHAEECTTWIARIYYWSHTESSLLSLSMFLLSINITRSTRINFLNQKYPRIIREMLVYLQINLVKLNVTLNRSIPITFLTSIISMNQMPHRWSLRINRFTQSLLFGWTNERSRINSPTQESWKTPLNCDHFHRIKGYRIKNTLTTPNQTSYYRTLRSTRRKNLNDSAMPSHNHHMARLSLAQSIQACHHVPRFFSMKVAKKRKFLYWTRRNNNNKSPNALHISREDRM